MNTITNNEQYVRLRIYEGELTPNEAYQELLRIEKEQRKSDNSFNQMRVDRLLEFIKSLDETPKE